MKTREQVLLAELSREIGEAQYFWGEGMLTDEEYDEMVYQVALRVAKAGDILAQGHSDLVMPEDQ